MSSKFKRVRAIMCLIIILSQSGCAWLIANSTNSDQKVSLMSGTRYSAHLISQSHEEYSWHPLLPVIAVIGFPITLLADVLVSPFILLIYFLPDIPQDIGDPTLSCPIHGIL